MRFRRANGGNIMARILRWRGLRAGRSVLFAPVLWLVPIDIPPIPLGLGLVRPVAASQDPGGFDPFGRDAGRLGDAAPAGTRRPARRRGWPRRGRARRPTPRPRPRATPPPSPPRRPARLLKFSQDIAPILVANCVGCHSKDQPGATKGKLDMSTFENLQKGTPAITRSSSAGKPRGQPPGACGSTARRSRRCPREATAPSSADAIAKITRWVKEGARLDAGHRSQGDHGFLRGVPRATAPQSSSPRCRPRSATRRSSRPGRRGGSSRARSRSPRWCRARTSSCSATYPTSGPPAR